jgi:F-type H+-transporting ATPase subunit gamma
METLESLSDALKTTDDIRAIVRTMKAVSSVSIRQYERAEEAMADYARTVDLGLTALLHRRRDAGLPLPAPLSGEAGLSALIVVGSDRGLCGRYNDAVARFAFARRNRGAGPLCAIGARVAARFEAQGWRPETPLALPGSVEGLSRLVQTVILAIDRWTRDRGVAQVALLHNRRDGRVAARPQARRLLPLAAADLSALASGEWPARSLPQVRMDPDRLLSWLVQQRLFVLVYRALTEALASEHASRLAAMQAAEKSIEERRDALSQLYRRRRQETITSELLDVVSGFEAAGGTGS